MLETVNCYIASKVICLQILPNIQVHTKKIVAQNPCTFVRFIITDILLKVYTEFLKNFLKMS